GDIPDWFADVPAGDWALHFLNARFGYIHYLSDCMSVYRKRPNGVWSRFSHDQAVVQVIKTLMLIDKGTDYEYHTDIMAGIRQRYETGDPARIQELIADDERLGLELSTYLERPDEETENAGSDRAQLASPASDPFLNP